MMPQPRRIVASFLACGLSLAGASAIIGCDREISSTEKVEHRSDGTTVKQKETVKETDNGTIVKEKEKSVDKTNP